MAGNIEVTTVAEDYIICHVFNGSFTKVIQINNLAPGSEITILGQRIKTLSRPNSELLTTVATVNDLHFGETECGKISGTSIGPILRANQANPYPEMMAQAAVNEIYLLNPDAVVAKGDLTAHGEVSEFNQFLETFEIFGNKMHYVLGNHDVVSSEIKIPEDKFVILNGVGLALINTTIPGKENGAVSKDTLEFLADWASSFKGPVLVFGHHHPWNPSSRVAPENYFGINPSDSVKLIKVFIEHKNLRGYFAGHTHRNRVRYFKEVPNVPFVEVAAVKDFPGSWAYYKVYETGIQQVHRRISSLEALNWSDKCRTLYSGRYAEYAFGEIEDRCFSFATA